MTEVVILNVVELKQGVIYGRTYTKDRRTY